MRLGLAFAVIVVAFVPRGASASCVGPGWDVDNKTVEPGGSIGISGDSFLNGCDDVGGGGLCGMGLPKERVTPMTDIRFALRRDGESIDGVAVSADENGDVAATLAVPSDAQAGTYKVVATYFGRTQEAVTVRVASD